MFFKFPSTYMLHAVQAVRLSIEKRLPYNLLPFYTVITVTQTVKKLWVRTSQNGLLSSKLTLGLQIYLLWTKKIRHRNWILNEIFKLYSPFLGTLKAVTNRNQEILYFGCRCAYLTMLINRMVWACNPLKSYQKSRIRDHPSLYIFMSKSFSSG